MHRIALLKFLKAKYGDSPPLPIAAMIIQLQQSLRRELKPPSDTKIEENISRWKPGEIKEES